MAEIKVSELPQAASSTPTDYIMIVQNGVNKKIPIASLLNTLDSTTNIQLNPSRNLINIILSSSNLPYLFYMNGLSDMIGVNTNSPQSLLHVMGNIQVGSSSNDGIVVHASEDILYSASTDYPQGTGWFKPLDASRDTSTLNVDTGLSVGQFDLQNGIPGQYKVLTMASGPTGSKCTTRVSAGVGFNRIDLTEPGYSVTLKCVSISGLPKWVCVGYYVATLYTV